MNVWDYFGIEQASDEKVLKKAYAAMLKSIRPETHEKEFMELRLFYETALKQIRYSNEFAHQREDDNISSCENIFEVCSNNYNKKNENKSTIHANASERESMSTSLETSYADETSFYELVNPSKKSDLIGSEFNQNNEYEIAENLIEQVKKFLLSGPKYLKDKSKLKAILEHEALINLKVKEIFIEHLFFLLSNPEFIEDQKKNNYIRNLLKIHAQINDFCGWPEREVELYKQYPPDRVDVVLSATRLIKNQNTVLEDSRLTSSIALRTSGILNAKSSIFSKILSILQFKDPNFIFIILKFLGNGLLVMGLFLGVLNIVDDTISCTISVLHLVLIGKIMTNFQSRMISFLAILFSGFNFNMYLSGLAEYANKNSPDNLGGYSVMIFLFAISFIFSICFFLLSLRFHQLIESKLVIRNVIFKIAISLLYVLCLLMILNFAVILCNLNIPSDVGCGVSYGIILLVLFLSFTGKLPYTTNIPSCYSPYMH